MPGLREAVADLSFQQLQEVMPRIVKGQEKTEFLSKHLPKLVEQMEAAQPARFRGADNERPQQRAPQRASGWEMGAA